MRETDAVTSLYVSVVHDRHTDPDIQLFTELDAALLRTREDFRKAVAHPARIEEEDPGDYLLLLTYPEGDVAWVEVAEVNEVHVEVHDGPVVYLD